MYAIYYAGKLIGIVTNPDNYPGGIQDICHRLSPDEGNADAVEIPNNMGNLEKIGKLMRALVALDVQEEIEVE